MGGWKEGGGEPKKKENAQDGNGKEGKKKCWISNPAIPTVARQMTLGMSRCHLFPLSGLSTYLQLQLKHDIPAFLHTEGQPSSPRAPEMQRHGQKRGRDGGREEGKERGGGDLASKSRDTARKGSDLFSNSLSSRAVIVINVLLPGRPLELQ